MLQRLPTPEGIPAQIELWQAGFDFSRAGTAADESDLSTAEQAHARRFRRPEDAHRFCCMRAHLRRLLAERLDCAPRDVPLVRNAWGKPQLARTAGLSFNLSHAGGVGLLAVAPGLELGIDIECESALDPAAGALHEMARQVLAPAEWDALTAPLDAALFLRHWVAKEAVLKALGLGIGEYLRDIQIRLEAPARYQIFHQQPQWPTPSRLHVRPLPSAPGHAAALAWIDA